MKGEASRGPAEAKGESSTVLPLRQGFSATAWEAGPQQQHLGGCTNISVRRVLLLLPHLVLLWDTQGGAALWGIWVRALALPPPQAMGLGGCGCCTNAALTPGAQHHGEGELCPPHTR